MTIWEVLGNEGVLENERILLYCDYSEDRD